MKNIISSSTKIAAIGLLLLSFLVISCKTEQEPDDPNITYVSINRSVTSVVANVGKLDSVDLNGDSKFDFFLLATSNATADTAKVYLIGNYGNSVYVDSTEGLGITLKAKNLFTDQVPVAKSASHEWYQYSYVGLRQGTEKKGYAGVGDVFIPILFVNASYTQQFYGWARVNVTSDYRTIKLVDVAFSVLPDTPIKMGAK